MTSRALILGISLTLLILAAGSWAAAASAPGSTSIPPSPAPVAGTGGPAPSRLPDPVSVTYTFQAPSVERVGAFDRVRMLGLRSHGEPGAPVLPVRTARILLPPGFKLGDVEVVPGEAAPLEGHYRIEPGQALRPIGTPPGPPTPPDPQIYQSADPFPGRFHTVASVQRLTGYAVLILQLHPVQYVPATGQISYVPRLTVTVHPGRPRLGATGPNLLRAIPADAGRVRRLVDNPQGVDAYATVPRDRGRRLSSALVDAGQPCDYVLITTQTLSPTFQTLIDWKAGRGLQARIYTTEEIYASYTGADHQEQIRNFIIDAYTAWSETAHPLQYVVLGGDDQDDDDNEIVPVRHIYAPDSGYSDWMPTDMYYGGLDGDWDADGDGRYGEASGDGEMGEECDFFAEVYVGRFTVNDGVEATNIISKTIAYEQNPAADYLDRALWLGKQLDERTWGGNALDVLSALIPQYNATKFYQRDGTYPGISTIMAEMNVGKHLVVFNGHANYSGRYPLNGSDIDGLANPDPFLLFSEGCHTAAFDQDMSGDAEATAEHYVYTEHGGFAYIGNTRYGWYSPGSTNGPGDRLCRGFLSTAANTADHHVGQALQLAKEDYYPGHRWSILTLALLGDPETPLVGVLADPVAHLSAPQGGTTVKHTLSIAGTARAGDRTGATFSHYVVEYGAGKGPSTWTQIGVTSTVAVDEGPLITWDTTTLADGTYTVRLRVDDGASRESRDRVVVETSNLYLTAPEEGQLVRGGDPVTVTGSALGSDFQRYVLEYGRGANPSSWTFVVSSTLPVTDSVLHVWDTSAITAADNYTLRLTRYGTAHNGSERVTVHVDPTWQAGWPQPVTQRLVAPSLAVGDIDGDGDLELVATEGKSGTYSLRVYAWHHDGTPVEGWPQWGYGGHLSAPALADLDRDGDLEIVVGASNNRVNVWHHDGRSMAGWPKSTGDEEEDAVFGAPAVADLDNDGWLEVVAATLDGQVYAWHYDGTAAAGWPQAAGGPLHSSPALGDLDGDVDWEVIAAGPGSVYAWHHDGSPVANWPVTGTPFVDVYSSPALGDIAGDDRPEIVVGIADQVYAWHGTGVPVAGWPRATTGTIDGSPALGDLDGSPGLEVVAGGTHLYAWHGDGTPVAGWPVTPALPTGSSPVLGDLTGDATVEVLVGGDDLDGNLYAWDGSGTPLTGWPRWVPAWDGSGEHHRRLASPLLTDLDGDGDVEVAIGAEGHVILFDLPGAYAASTMEWPIYQHDLHYTGWYTDSWPNLPPFVRDVVAGPGYVAPGAAVTVTARVTDEDGVAAVLAEIESPDNTPVITLTLLDDGAHGDGAPGDGVYGGTWTTTLDKRDYVVDVQATDGLSNTCLHDNLADFTTTDVPYVQYHGYTIHQEDLVADGHPNPGEFVQGALTLKNIGPIDAQAVTATVTIDDWSNVWWWTTMPIPFGPIPSGSTGTSEEDAFYVQVSTSCPPSQTLSFDLLVESSQGYSWTDQIDLTVIDAVGPVLYFTTAEPRYTVAGNPVTVSADVEDGAGISSVQAIIESPDETPVVTLTLHCDDPDGTREGKPTRGTFANTWATDPAERTYQVDLLTEDAVGNLSTHDNVTAFTTQPFSQTADVLLFADGGGGAVSGNPFGYYTATLNALTVDYDVWDAYWYGQVPFSTLQAYTDGVVIWAVPSWGYAAQANQQQCMCDYLDGGGRLFVSGQNVGAFASNSELLEDYLQATHVQYNVGSHVLGGVAGDIIGDGLQLTISGGDGANNQTAPDEIAPRASAATVFTFTGGTAGGTGAVRVDAGTYRAVYFSFGFEAIDNAQDRATVMERVLFWLRAQEVYLPLVLRGGEN